jgi:[protein-PII] uridylyltransferase
VISPLEELKLSRSELLERFLEGSHDGFEERHSSIIDHYFIRGLQESRTGSMLFRDNKTFALVALGGYGRGELCLRSDIDIMVLFGSKIPDEAGRLTDEILLPLWDLGLEPGHCVRTIADCTALAKEDFEVFTSLLDARFICGESRTYLKLRQALAKKVIAKKAAGFARWLEDRNRIRMEIFGDATYLLEPNLKEGIGGLRDYHQILWLSKAFFGIQNPRDLEFLGRMSHGRFEALKKDVAFLSLARNHLHHLSGRKNDRLGFEYQEDIAARLGFEDKDGYPAVEHFLGMLHRTMASVKALRISFVSSCIHSTGKWREKALHEGLPRGLRFEGDQISFESVTSILENPILLMEIFLHSASCGCTVSMEAGTLVKEFLHLVDDRYREDSRAVSVFLAILEEEHSFEALVQMNDIGLLETFVPEMGKVRDRVQFDAYHIYPVGIHCLHTLKNLKEVSRERNLILIDVMKEIKDPMVLYLAGILHDIGKTGKNHCERGAEIAGEILFRFGYDPLKSEDVVFLIRNHLLLAESATRRDLNDEKTVVQCASVIGTMERAKMLYLLTWADSKATGPRAWNNWIANLLTELFLKVLHILERGEFAGIDARRKEEYTKAYVIQATEDEAARKKTESLFEVMPPGYLLYTRPSLVLRHTQMAIDLKEQKAGGKNPPFRLHASQDEEVKGCWEMSFLAHDRAGLFSEISGVLAINNINILSAQIHTWLDGTAVDIFRVSSLPDPLHPEIIWERVRRDLSDLWGNSSLLESRVREKAAGSIGFSRSRPSKPPKVRIDNNSSDFFTIVEVFADDRIGLLHLITRTLSSLGLDIRLAKIATKGDQVADVFYVLDMEGQKVEERELTERVREALLTALNGG